MESGKEEGALYHEAGAGERAPAEDRSAGQLAAEQHILRFSMLSALFFAILGLACGLAIDSRMIQFDAVFSLASVATSCVFLRAAKLVRRGGDARFPFGRSQMEPMLLALRSLAFLAVCGMALASAVEAALQGGRATSYVWATAYAGAGLAGCLGSWLYILAKSRGAGLSRLVKAEADQWLQDTALCVALLAGFGVAACMERGNLAPFARYADPVMTMVAAVIIVLAPIGELLRAIKDMLLMAPGDGVYRASTEALKEIARRKGFAGVLLRVCSEGRALMYEISFVAADPGERRSMGELDDIRNEVRSRLDGLFDHPKRLRIGFVHDAKWG